jgi:Xaa-Pro aminopeptidase
VIDAYVQAMDQTLQRWQRESIRISRELDAMKGDDEATRLRRVAGATAWADLTAGITRVSEGVVAPIAAGLDTEHRTAFLLGVDKLTYPQAFERCPSEIALEALKMTPDIAPEKRAAIDVVYADYAPKRDQVRAQIIEVVRKWEKGGYPAKREMEQLWPATERGEMSREDAHRRTDELLKQHPANPLLEKRHDLAIEAVHSMRGVLSDDEIARMPLAAQLALMAW